MIKMSRIFVNFQVIKQFIAFKNVHTSALTCARAGTRNKNPGIGHQAEIFKDDTKFTESLEDEEDIARLESDFSQADLSFHEHKQMMRRKKFKIDGMITKKKFFADPQQPNMLTWLERFQIKKLHSEDPETWNLDVLAESFPATREIISKVLKQKWHPETKSKMKKMDDKVHENWKLLAEGKLEADELFLNHVRTFLPRREDHLAALQMEDLSGFLAPPQPKPVWNNGQMSKILESYEKSLELLDTNQQKMIESKGGVTEEPKLLENLNSFENVKNTKPVESKGGVIEEPKLFENVKNKEPVESKGGTVEPKLFKKVKNTKPVTSRLVELAGYSPKPVTEEIMENEKNTISESRPEEIIQKIPQNQFKTQTKVQSQPVEPTTKIPESPNYSESDIEELTIQDTFFWPNPEAKQPDSKNMTAPVKQKNARYNYSYPERIKIPKNQKKAGLTYKQNDCFYDDDGEFLYRVPGMTKN